MISIIISEIFDDQFNLFNLFVVLHIYYMWVYIYLICVYIYMWYVMTYHIYIHTHTMHVHIELYNFPFKMSFNAFSIIFLKERDFVYWSNLFLLWYILYYVFMLYFYYDWHLLYLVLLCCLCYHFWYILSLLFLFLVCPCVLFRAFKAPSSLLNTDLATSHDFWYVAYPLSSI